MSVSDHTVPCSRARAQALSCQELRLEWRFLAGVTLHPRTSGAVWGHSWLSQLGKKMLLASTVPRVAAQHPTGHSTIPPTKNYLVQMSEVLTLRNPLSGTHQVHMRLFTSVYYT